MRPTPVPSTSRPEDELLPLDRSLRQSVMRRADTMTRDAQHDADERIAAASREADALVERARREGAAVADAMLARERAAQRREAASTVLAAKQSVIDNLYERVRAAVLNLRNAPDYPSLLEGLAARGRAQLGDDATVTADPDDVGGVIVELGTRRIDYTLPSLAGRALAALGDAVDELLR